MSIGGNTWQLGDTTLFRVSSRILAILIDTGTAAPGQPNMECFTYRHSNMDIGPTFQGWAPVPGKCGTLVGSLLPSVLDPRPTPDTSGVATAPAPSGPNTGLWYVTALTTKLHLRAQLLRDFRSDALGLMVRPADAVAPGCRTHTGLGPAPIPRSGQLVSWTRRACRIPGSAARRFPLEA